MIEREEVRVRIEEEKEGERGRERNIEGERGARDKN